MPVISSGCELDVDRGPNWLFVKVKPLDEDDTEIPALADQLWSLLDQAFTYRLVLEMDEVRMLPSQLIGQLVLLHKRICLRGGMMRLSGLSAGNQQVLQTCRLADRFPAYRNRVEAVMGTSPCKPR